MKGDICRIEGCSKIVTTKGLVCRSCWTLKSRYGSFTHVVEAIPKIKAIKCRIEGCDNPLRFNSLVCGSCWKKKNKYGSFTHQLSPRPTLEERFWSTVNKTESCWLWTGTIEPGGYGRINVKNKTLTAHRVSWGLNIGQIPEGMFVLHHCDIRNCVNPSHLYLGNNQDNMTDMVNRGRHVPQHMKGVLHPLAKLNVMEVKNIKELIKNGESCIEIAKKYNVSRQAISSIKHNRSWTHIKEQTNDK